jgi:hypothetical protein
MRPSARALLASTCLALSAPPAAASTPIVDAPPSLAALAERVVGIDMEALGRALARADLALPPRVHITLVAEDEDRARQTPRWIVGQAYGAGEIVIFPQRISSYPYDSLDTVVRHEIVHLALAARADGRPLPRWFHEGVAVSLESGWGVTDQLRLAVAASSDPAIADVSRLFRSDSRPDTEQAYLLAAALVADLQRRHGPGLPGRIAAHVARGVPFSQAFARETGETADEAAARAWAVYRRWQQWVLAVSSPAAIWTLILSLAIVAGIVRLQRKARRRRAWDEEEN